MELGKEPLRVSLAPAPGGNERLEPGAGRLLLRVDGLQPDRPPGVFYELYLNLPPGARPDPDGPHYVGNLGFFGRTGQPGGAGAPTSQVFDVTAVARALEARGLWAGHEVSVTFVQRGLESTRTGQALPAKTTGTIRVGQVSLIRG